VNAYEAEDQPLSVLADWVCINENCDGVHHYYVNKS